MTPIWSCYLETDSGCMIKNITAETFDEAEELFFRWAKVKVDPDTNLPIDLRELEIVKVIDEEGTPVYNDGITEEEAE